MSVTAKVDPPFREEKMPAPASLQGGLPSQIRPIPATFAEEIMARRSDLNQSWEHLLAGRFEVGAASAAKLVDYLTSLSVVEDDDRAAAKVLLASAQVVLGCCYELTPARQDESARLFGSAAQLFEEYFDKLRTKSPQDFRYSGLASLGPVERGKQGSAGTPRSRRAIPPLRPTVCSPSIASGWTSSRLPGSTSKRRWLSHPIHRRSTSSVPRSSTARGIASRRSGHTRRRSIDWRLPAGSMRRWRCWSGSMHWE